MDGPIDKGIISIVLGIHIVFNSFEEPGEKSFIEIRRVLPPAAARLARTAHLPDRP